MERIFEEYLSNNFKYHIPRPLGVPEIHLNAPGSSWHWPFDELNFDYLRGISPSSMNHMPPNEYWDLDVNYNLYVSNDQNFWKMGFDICV